MPQNTSESHCHCNAKFNGSDHCPYCGCEQYERYCNASYPDRNADHWWCPGAEFGKFRVPPPTKALTENLAHRINGDAEPYITH